MRQILQPATISTNALSTTAVAGRPRTSTARTRWGRTQNVAQATLPATLMRAPTATAMVYASVRLLDLLRSCWLAAPLRQRGSGTGGATTARRISISTVLHGGTTTAIVWSNNQSMCLTSLVSIPQLLQVFLKELFCSSFIFCTPDWNHK